jgi:type IV pilus assembly protein PilC
MAEENTENRKEPGIKIEPIEDVTSPDAGEKKKGLKQEIAFFPPNTRDMAIFCRQLATLLDVGIPLLRSLKILSERTQHPRLKKVVGAVAARVEEGQSLSSSLAEHPKVFSALFVNVVRVGEVGGILDNSLKRLADILEKKSDIKKKIIAALAYPTAAFVVALGVIIVILAVAIPRFAEVYAKEEADLPGITKVVLAISAFVRGYPFIYVPLILAAIIGIWFYGRTPPGKWMFDQLRLRLPVIGGINMKINVARFSRTIGGLLDAGIPLLEALNLSAQTSENVVVAKALKETHDSVEQGGKMDVPLRKNSIFPDMVVDMIAIGDEAGAMDTMLNKIADTYETDVDASLRGLTALIEPLLIVFMGFVVIFIALAVLLPYFNLVNVVGAE